MSSLILNILEAFFKKKKTKDNKGKESIICMKFEVENYPSGSPFAIPWQASWCQTLIFGTNFYIPTFYS